MPITPLGVIGTGSASGSDHVDIPLSVGVPRSSPALAAHVAILVHGAGPAHRTVSGITDNAPAQPTYGTCYGTGNQYRRIGVESGSSSWDVDLWGGIVLHDLSIGNVITVQYPGAWTDIRAIACAFTGGLAAPSPFAASTLACVLGPDIGGAPSGDIALYFQDPCHPSGICPCQHSTGNILQPGNDWDLSAALSYLLYADNVTGAGAVGPFTFDDAGVTVLGGWNNAGANGLTGNLGQQLMAGPVGPHVGADIPLGGCWGAPVVFANTVGQAVGIQAGAGPPLCQSPPPTPSGKRKCCGSRCLCTTLSLPAGGTFTIQDSSGAAIFEVRDDGTVHILTGGTIHADL